MRNKRANKEKGFSLVEVVIASALISLTLLSVITIARQSITISRRALNTYNASTLLEEGGEAVRIIRDGAWANITGLTVGTTYYPSFSTTTNTWSLATTSSTVGIYTRSVVISNVSRDTNDDIVTSGGTNDTGTKKVVVTVSWPEGATTLTKTLSFYISNIF